MKIKEDINNNLVLILNEYCNKAKKDSKDKNNNLFNKLSDLNHIVATCTEENIINIQCNSKELEPLVSEYIKFKTRDKNTIMIITIGKNTPINYYHLLKKLSAYSEVSLLAPSISDNDSISIYLAFYTYEKGYYYNIDLATHFL